MSNDMGIALVAAGAVVLIGIVLLFRRMSFSGKRDSGPIKSQNEKFIERLLKEDARPAEIPARAAPPRARGRPKVDMATEQTFRNMFFTSADKGEGLIEYYMTRHKCGRREAMQRAIEDREREAGTRIVHYGIRDGQAAVLPRPACCRSAQGPA